MTPKAFQPSSHNKYKSVIHDFLLQNDGTIVVLSADQSFLNLIRLTLNKELEINDASKLIAVSTLLTLDRELDCLKEQNTPVLLFIEHRLSNQEMCYFIPSLKERYPDMRIIMLVLATDKDRLMLFYEMGIDNVIAKPVSINTLIEKLTLTLQPQSKIGVLVNSAKSMLKSENYTGTLKICKHILTKKSDCAIAYLLTGDAYLALKQPRKAERAYLAASKISVLFLEPLERLARLQQEAGNFTEQLEYLSQLESLSPLNPKRKIDIGTIMLNMGQDEEAEQLFSAALAQYVREAKQLAQDISVKIADAYVEKNPELAQEYYQKSLELKGELGIEDLETFNSLGLLLRKQGRWQQAINEYKRALRIAPNDENLYYNIGMAYAEGKNRDAACDSLLRALQLNPKLPYVSSVIAQNMGIIFLQGQIVNQARTCLEIALKLDPKSQVAQKAWDKLPAT